ncbi:hypothetical protein AAY473_033591 [Plecturocebus cupreus]
MLAKTAALRFVVLFCPGVSGLASQSLFQSAGWTALTFQSTKHHPKGDSVPFTPHQEPPSRGAGKKAAPAEKVAVATRGAPPLGMSWSVGSKNVSSLAVSPRLEYSGTTSAHCNLRLSGSIEMGFHRVGEAGFELLTSSDSPASASQSPRITGIRCPWISLLETQESLQGHYRDCNSLLLHYQLNLTVSPRLECSGVISVHFNLSLLGSIEMGFHHVGQAGLKLPTSCDPHPLASQSAEITDPTPAKGKPGMESLRACEQAWDPATVHSQVCWLWQSGQLQALAQVLALCEAKAGPGILQAASTVGTGKCSGNQKLGDARNHRPPKRVSQP